LISFFTSNEQSLHGVQDVMKRARAGHGRLPVDRMKLLVVPVPSRDESGSEYELADEWRGRYAEALGEFFADWTPKDEDPKNVLDFLKIPYFAYWSFGERVPVLEERDPENPKTLAYAYQPLARLVLTKLDWSEARAGTMSTELSRKHEAEAEQARLEARRLEEQGARNREAMAKTKRFLEGRLTEQVKNLRRLALRYRRIMLLLIVAGGGSGLMFPVAYYLYTQEGPVTLFTEFQVVAAMYFSAVVAAIALLLWRVARFDTRARIADMGAKELESRASLFSARVGADNAEDELQAFVGEIEQKVSEIQWAISHPRKFYSSATQ
jgi:hypothetical protein